MDFKNIFQEMKKSKVVKTYIYLWIIVSILFGIGIYLYLITSKMTTEIKNPFIDLSNPFIALLISVIFVVVFIVELIFNARFLLLAGFIKGNKNTIRFQIAIVIIAILGIIIFYKTFIETYGVILTSIIPVVGFLIIIFDFLRLRELK